jgi:hypothetical protein
MLLLRDNKKIVRTALFYFDIIHGSRYYSLSQSITLIICGAHPAIVAAVSLDIFSNKTGGFIKQDIPIKLGELTCGGFPGGASSQPNLLLHC